MSVRTDVINLQVNVNGNNAQNSLNELKNKAKQIGYEMLDLKEGTQEYIDKAAELKKVTGEMDALKKQIGITALSQKELNAELKKLKALQGSTIPFSEEYKALGKNIKEVENRLYDVKNGVQGLSSTFSKVKDEIKQFGAVALGYLGFQFLAAQFTNIISGAGKLSDQLADLRRVAGFTAAEADKLNGSLGKIDTRTAVGSLRDIAIVAGKLGVAKEDVLGFTTAVDMLVVALGDELGDADQITTQLGKILNVFDGNVNGDNISKLGNAFVTLANAGVASGGFIAEFDQRLAGTAKTAGISLGALSGLGAGLEELGARTESSTTAIQSLLGSIAADIPAAAKTAGAKSEEEFRKLFNTDALEALLQYSEGLVKNKNSFEEVTASIKGTGEEGARTVAVINTLGTSSELLRKKIDLGTESIKANSAITAAFALKNETFGATLDKLGKQLNSLVAGSGVATFFKGIVEGAIDFLNVIKGIPKFIDDNSTALKLLAAGLILLNFQYIRSAATIVIDTALRVANLFVLQQSTIFTRIATASQLAYSTIMSLVAGRITIATAAQRLWNIAIATGLGPIGVLVTIIGAAVFAFNALSSSSSAAATAARTLQEVQSRSAETNAEELQKIRELTNVLKDQKVSRETQTAALEQLIALNPEYLKGLTLENAATAEGKRIIDAYVLSLKEKAYQQAAQEVQTEAIKRDIKLLQQQVEIETQIANGRATYGPGNLFKVGQSLEESVLNEIKSNRAKIGVELETTDKIIKEKYKSFGAAGKKLDDSVVPGKGLIEKLQAAIKKLDEDIPKITEKDGGRALIAKKIAERVELQRQLDALEGKTEKKSAAEKKGESELERLRKEGKKFSEELKKLAAKSAAGTLSENDKEVALIEQKYQELLSRAVKYWKKNSAIGQDAVANIQTIRTNELTALYKKIFAENSAKEYQTSLDESADFFDQLKSAAAANYLSGKLSKQQYEDELISIEQRSNSNRLQIATDYAGTVKKAEQDVTKFKHTELEKQVKDKLAANEKQIKDKLAADEKQKKQTVNDLLAETKLKVLNTVKGSDARLEAEKNYLRTKFELTEKNEDDTVKMRELKEKELADAIKELDRQAFQAKVDNVLQYVNAFQQALDSLNTIINNKENRELAKEKKGNDQKVKGYRTQLDNKLISQGQYDKQVQKLQDEQEKREKEIKLRQAKREKALNIFNAIISTAAGIAKASPNIALMVLAGILGGLQIKAISNAPLPELGRGGHLINGPKHSDSQKGLHVVNPLTGRTEMLLEREEAVLAAAAMNSNRQMTVSGTPRQIASALNSSHGGVSFASGARVMTMTPQWANQPQPYIRPGIVRMMAQGGVVGGQIDSSSTTAATEAHLALLASLNDKFDGMRDDIQSFDREKKSYVVLKEIKQQDSLYNAARAASGI